MLQRGDILERYEVNSLIGRGGFGFVYMGKHAELGIDVAIKEYFPSELSIREDGTVQPSNPEFRELFAEGLDRFLKEAKQLERFRECPAIVTCRDFFRANGTAYMIMDYVTGLSLASLMEQRESGGDPFTERELVDLIQPLLAGLQMVHESRVFLRDLHPSNILVCQNAGSPILIDFGAAKQETGKHTKSFAPYTDGYAAVEQVGEGNIGSWTDIYGIGAVMWRMVAGGAPPNPVPIQKRIFALLQGEADPLPTAREVGKGRFSDEILQAIDDCLIISVQDRIQDELSHRLDGSTVVAMGEIDQIDKDVEELEIFGEQVANNPESDSSASRVERGKKRTVVGDSVILGVIVLTWVHSRLTHRLNGGWATNRLIERRIVHELFSWIDS